MLFGFCSDGYFEVGYVVVSVFSSSLVSIFIESVSVDFGAVYVLSVDDGYDEGVVVDGLADGLELEVLDPDESVVVGYVVGVVSLGYGFVSVDKVLSVDVVG